MAEKKKTGESGDSRTFEQRLTRLEQLSEQIRDGEISLEDATKFFEEGMKLARGLEKDLAKVERRVEILRNQPPIEAGEEASAEDSGAGDTSEAPELSLFSETGNQGSNQ
jgi:exodeoxyribonuclease VII small subunit